MSKKKKSKSPAWVESWFKDCCEVYGTPVESFTESTKKAVEDAKSNRFTKVEDF